MKSNLKSVNENLFTDEVRSLNTFHKRAACKTIVLSSVTGVLSILSWCGVTASYYQKGLLRSSSAGGKQGGLVARRWPRGLGCTKLMLDYWNAANAAPILIQHRRLQRAWACGCLG